MGLPGRHWTGMTCTDGRPRFVYVSDCLPISADSSRTGGIYQKFNFDWRYPTNSYRLSHFPRPFPKIRIFQGLFRKTTR
ncbi:unnamed protein product [Nesidiocoris tenuis]|uniref:Uncharacterized protein n=1 Tax=Nesidiocoris tenuis TaxID=355587 RepID=A0A6H5GBG1_9HEMI|nr:unnamed protein product [Nesidiocoris tenuis]